METLCRGGKKASTLYWDELLGTLHKYLVQLSPLVHTDPHSAELFSFLVARFRISWVFGTSALVIFLPLMYGLEMDKVILFRAVEGEMPPTYLLAHGFCLPVSIMPI